jgi:hypothetical protein
MRREAIQPPKSNATTTTTTVQGRRKAKREMEKAFIGGRSSGDSADVSGDSVLLDFAGSREGFKNQDGFKELKAHSRRFESNCVTIRRRSVSGA